VGIGGTAGDAISMPLLAWLRRLEIQGKRPSYYLHFDDNLDDEKRVEQVVAWLKLRLSFDRISSLSIIQTLTTPDTTMARTPTRCGPLFIMWTRWLEI